jgi:hypothetical protein
MTFVSRCKYAALTLRSAVFAASLSAKVLEVCEPASAPLRCLKPRQRIDATDPRSALECHPHDRGAWIPSIVGGVVTAV